MERARQEAQKYKPKSLGLGESSGFGGALYGDAFGTAPKPQSTSKPRKKRRKTRKKGKKKR